MIAQIALFLQYTFSILSTYMYLQGALNMRGYRYLESLSFYAVEFLPESTSRVLFLLKTCIYLVVTYVQVWVTIERTNRYVWVNKNERFLLRALVNDSGALICRCYIAVTSVWSYSTSARTFDWYPISFCIRFQPARKVDLFLPNFVSDIVCATQTRIAQAVFGSALFQPQKKTAQICKCPL